MPVGRGTVTYLHVIPQHGRAPLMQTEVTAVVDAGISGDVHAQKARGRRQVLLLDQGILAAVGLPPGALREQITVDFPELEHLAVGTVLHIGQATLEITGPCDPCTHIGKLAGVGDSATFQAALAGRRGVLARVVGIEGDGRIRIGDVIAAVDARDAARR